MTSMKILYISDTLALWGGIERVLSCKANELAEHYGYKVCFVHTVKWFLHFLTVLPGLYFKLSEKACFCAGFTTPGK